MLFACSTCWEAVLSPSVGVKVNASGELPGGVGRGTSRELIESGRWLVRLHNGYDDGFQRMSSYMGVEAENAVGEASVP